LKSPEEKKKHEKGNGSVSEWGGVSNLIRVEGKKRITHKGTSFGIKGTRRSARKERNFKETGSSELAKYEGAGERVSSPKKNRGTLNFRNKGVKKEKQNSSLKGWSKKVLKGPDYAYKKITLGRGPRGLNISQTKKEKKEENL